MAENKDATETQDKGAPEEKDGHSKHQERRESVERVLEGRHKELEADGIHIDPGKELVPPEEEKDLEVEPDKEEEPTVEEPKEEPTEEPAEEMVTIKVRGEEKQVPISQVYEAGTRVLQKETDLEKRYDEVTKMQKELQRKLDGLPPEKPSVPDKEEDAPEEDEEDYNELAYALQYGTSEEAADAVRKLRGSGIDEDTIRKAVQQIRAEEKQADIMGRLKQPKADGGFADLMDGGVLQSRFAAEVDILVTHENMAYDSLETYKKAGEAVRKQYVSATTRVEVPEAKKQRKEATDTVKGANIKDDSESETEMETPVSGDKSAQDVVHAIKKARGQI